MHIADVALIAGDRLRAEAYLRTGSKVTVSKDYFELENKSIAVIGTTHMFSEVPRLLFEYPNAYVWDQDLDQISSAGPNMIRAGWWTGWEKAFLAGN
jgi:hypothetical protein